MQREPVRVRCYSGQTRAERPLSLVWDGTELAVRSVESGWREPGEKCFRIRTDDDRRFVLRYNERSDRWTAVE